MASDPVHRIHLGDNLDVLRALPDASIDLVYADPPFNTGKRQERTRLRMARAEDGDRTGFQGRRYATLRGATRSFDDRFDDYLAFLEPRLTEIRRVLAPHGSLYLHLDFRESHGAKLLLDQIFGRTQFLNEIVWAYDYGGRARDRWPAKHDTILLYAREAGRHVFDANAVERIPYMAPGLVTPEKAARGKLPTDVWWHTIVPTAGRERTGYPAQKPLGILRRIVAASSAPGALVLDPFAGSGTTGAACIELGRRFVLADESPEALRVMARRFAGVPGIAWSGFDPVAEAGEAKP
ncbi:MAG: site-specific DNA-methyltransferase [Deltaproteobacteria bacterium]|nr:site-specific DNA-methyltransferase [Deltaproteobacteria bacterium]